MLCAVLASCGSDGDGEGLGNAVALPVRDSAQGPAGTALRDGFTVEEATVLIGAPIPVAGDGWWALLFVEGNPVDAMEGYLRQAEDLGLTRDEVLAGGPEFLREDIPAEKQQYTSCGVAAEGRGGWRCTAAALTDRGAPCAHIEVVRREAAGTVQSFLLLGFNTSPQGCVPGTAQMVGDPDAVPPPLPSEWPALPDAGAVLDESWGLLAGLRVEGGSAVATLPFEGGCGEAALLEVTGDSLAVLDAYTAQLDEWAPTNDPPPARVTRIDDRTELYEVARSTGGGGNLYTAVLARYDDDTDYLVLNACSG
jgi:hypothetical protein